MNTRPDIAKCEGIGSDLCKTCVRKLAPAAPIYQAWTVPHENRRGGCDIYADVKKYEGLYQGGEITPLP